MYTLTYVCMYVAIKVYFSYYNVYFIVTVWIYLYISHRITLCINNLLLGVDTGASASPSGQHSNGC